MRQIEIRYNPYRYRFAYYIDGEPVTSKYHGISNVMSQQERQFHIWAPAIFHNLDQDLNENYELTFVGREIEGEILRTYQSTSKFCKGMNVVPCKIPSTTRERLAILEQYSSNNGYPMTFSEKLPVYTDDLDRVKELGIERYWLNTKMFPCPVEYYDISTIQASAGNYALIILFHHRPGEMRTERIHFGRIYIVGINDAATPSLRKNEDVYSIEVPLNKAPETIDKFLDYEALPYLLYIAVDECIKKGKDKEKLQMLLETDAYAYIQDFPRDEHGRIIIEEGLELRPVIRWLPEDMPCPKVWLESSDESVIGLNGTRLIGIKQGTSRIIVREAGKAKPIFDEKIYCIHRNRITDIRVDTPYIEASVGSIIPLYYTYYPEDADNADMISISISNPDVLQVESNNELTAVGVGGSRVTIQAENISVSMQVDILEAMSTYHIVPSSMKLLLGQKAKIEIGPNPPGAYFNPYSVQIDPQGIVNYNDMDHSVSALRPGKAVIRFKEENGHIFSDLVVTVREESRGAWIKVFLALILGIILIIMVARFLF